MLEIVDIEQHVDRVELNINVELIQDIDRHVGFYARLDIQRGPERTLIARGNRMLAVPPIFLPFCPNSLSYWRLTLSASTHKFARTGKARFVIMEIVNN